MNGIENITKRIADDAEKEALKIISEAEKEAEAVRKEYAKKGEDIRNAIIERGKKSASERESRLCGVAGLEARKTSLAKKQELISRAFDAAIKKLSDLSDDERADALAALALRAADGGKGEIILSASERAAIGDKIIAKCAANSGITLSAETREIGGGLILRDGASEVNCTFEALVYGQRDTLGREIADILFG